MMEIWKPIPGYEGIYDASNLGRIRSTPGKTTSNARYEMRVWKSRILKEKYPKSKKRQDARVSLCKGGKEKDALVSRLVASAWHGEPNPKNLTVNHINGDWSDNRQENLEWVSLSENIRLGFENGQYDSFQKKIAICDDDGNIYYFKSFSKAAQFLERNKGYVGYVIGRKGKYLYSADNKRFRIVECDGGL